MFFPRIFARIILSALIFWDCLCFVVDSKVTFFDVDSDSGVVMLSMKDSKFCSYLIRFDGGYHGSADIFFASKNSIVSKWMMTNYTAIVNPGRYHATIFEIACSDNISTKQSGFSHFENYSRPEIEREMPCTAKVVFKSESFLIKKKKAARKQ